ncbi:MAG: hypothetical protein KC550_07225 [Nanoarchaeota archaeon]|nr:hypothetical protein [Nanoarchaeota archaeon]
MKLSRILFIGVITIILSSSPIYSDCDAHGCTIPDEMRIKNDLIGTSVSSKEGNWNFDSLSEFKEFRIINTLDSGMVVEYVIDLTLRDMRSFKSYYAKIHVVYKLVDVEYNGGEYKYSEREYKHVKTNLLKYIEMKL